MDVIRRENEKGLQQQKKIRETVMKETSVLIARAKTKAKAPQQRAKPADANSMEMESITRKKNKEKKELLNKKYNEIREKKLEQ